MSFLSLLSYVSIPVTITPEPALSVKISIFSSAISSLINNRFSPDDFLFCNNYGGQASNRTWQTLVYRYNIKRGVNVTSIHAFRHSFSRLWLLNHGDIMRLKTILGHSNIAVTNEYLQMFGQDLQMDFEKFNPLDNLKKKEAQIRM